MFGLTVFENKILKVFSSYSDDNFWLWFQPTPGIIIWKKIEYTWVFPYNKAFHWRNCFLRILRKIFFNLFLSKTSNPHRGLTLTPVIKIWKIKNRNLPKRCFYSFELWLSIKCQQILNYCLKTSQFDNLSPSSLLCVRLNWHWPRVQEEGKFVSVNVFRQIDRHNYR